ncbi:MAG: AlbA family DNA-binding domain-containing protein [Gammaproteobacteria bacterium]
MLKYAYYPFKSPLEEIGGSDLILLKDIAEGWYVDYKTRGLKIVDYAKHLAAFANQYVGWLIIGVSEFDDGSRTAGKFPGIDNADIEKISRDLREAAAAHVNPEVLYEEKVLEGPIEEVGLVNGKSIIIVGIPRSLNTPHIHSSGRIYRRLADQSKPKEETDRFILDELWTRGDEHQKKITKSLTQTPRLPESQAKSPWAHIFFKPSESQLQPNINLKFDEFVEIVTNFNGRTVGVQAPMQAVNTTSKGYVARQIEGNNPSLASLSINWCHDGSVRFDIPFNQYGISSFMRTHEKNQYAREYCKLAQSSGYHHEMKIVDYSLFTQTIASLCNFYLHMLDITKDERDIYSCFTFRNMFHTSPYIDSTAFIERIKKLSLPLTVDQDIVFPQEPTEDNMFLHSANTRKIDYLDYENRQLRPYLFALPIVFRIFISVGLVPDDNTFLDDTELWGFNKMNNSVSP